MQYEDNTTPFNNGKDLKKRLENIQGELRYLSYSSEILVKELRLIAQKIESIVADPIDCEATEVEDSLRWASLQMIGG